MSMIPAIEIVVVFYYVTLVVLFKRIRWTTIVQIVEALTNVLLAKSVSDVL